MLKLHRLAALVAVIGLVGPASSGLLCLTTPASGEAEHGCCAADAGLSASPVPCCDDDSAPPSSPAAAASTALAAHTVAAGRTPPAPHSLVALAPGFVSSVPTPVLRI